MEDRKVFSFGYEDTDKKLEIELYGLVFEIRNLNSIEELENLDKNNYNSIEEQLEKILDIPIHLQDERLTTKSATDMLIMGNVSRKDRKKVVDSLAATIILQSYLDRRDK